PSTSAEPSQAPSASAGFPPARSASEGIAGSGEVRLEIRDNGVGMPGNLEQAKGMGVRIMRYRAALIGASLEIGAGENGGTVVVCTVQQGENNEPASPKH